MSKREGNDRRQNSLKLFLSVASCKHCLRKFQHIRSSLSEAVICGRLQQISPRGTQQHQPLSSLVNQLRRLLECKAAIYYGATELKHAQKNKCVKAATHTHHQGGFYATAQTE